MKVKVKVARCFDVDVWQITIESFGILYIDFFPLNHVWVKKAGLIGVQFIRWFDKDNKSAYL